MLITVLGGSGFIGRHVVKALAKAGHRVRVACRRPDLAGHVMTAGTQGQIAVMQANLRYPASIEAAIVGADAVVNCIGLLHETGKQTFSAVQSEGVATLATLAYKHSIPLVHISAIGADNQSLSQYAQSKATGEAAVLAHKGNIVLRPSIVFGAEDQFLNRFAFMATLSPVIPLVGADTNFQPVAVGDVAAMVLKAVQGELPHTLYELGGERKSFKTIVEDMLVVIGRKRLVLPLPFAIAKPLAAILQYAPTTPLTPDHVLLLANDNVVSENAQKEGRTLEGAGITPTTLAATMPNQLWRFRKGGQFNAVAEKPLVAKI